MQNKLSEKEMNSYNSAGIVAEEILGNIRTVVAFGGEEKEIERYKSNLTPAEHNGKRKGQFSGLGGGIMWFIIFCIYALAFWYGIQLILQERDKVDKEYTPAILIIVSLMFTFFYLSIITNFYRFYLVLQWELKHLE
jgi:ATP-binding cassette subfamily B (MDR/TAP) protein 1